jgi:hypothetical protein
VSSGGRPVETSLPFTFYQNPGVLAAALILLTKCRNSIGDIKTEGFRLSLAKTRFKGGCLWLAFSLLVPLTASG